LLNPLELAVFCDLPSPTPQGNPAQACSAQPDILDFWFTVPSGGGNGIFSTAVSDTVAPGGSAPYTATMVPLGLKSTVSARLNFDGVQNIPGATASWFSGSIAPNQSATFTVNTSASTPAGTYQITLFARPAGGNKVSHLAGNYLFGLGNFT
jgi:hypothetical protein